MLDLNTNRCFCLFLKFFNGLVPPPLMDFVLKKINTGLNSRAPIRGDCNVRWCKTTLGQSGVNISHVVSISLLLCHVTPYQFMLGTVTTIKCFSLCDYSVVLVMLYSV